MSPTKTINLVCLKQYLLLCKFKGTVLQYRNKIEHTIISRTKLHKHVFIPKRSFSFLNNRFYIFGKDIYIGIKILVSFQSLTVNLI